MSNKTLGLTFIVVSIFFAFMGETTTWAILLSSGWYFYMKGE